MLSIDSGQHGSPITSFDCRHLNDCDIPNAVTSSSYLPLHHFFLLRSSRPVCAVVIRRHFIISCSYPTRPLGFHFCPPSLEVLARRGCPDRGKGKKVFRGRLVCAALWTFLFPIVVVAGVIPLSYLVCFISLYFPRFIKTYLISFLTHS